MESSGYHHDLALLEWQIELGAVEAIGDAPVNRYDVPAAQEKTRAPAVAPAAPAHAAPAAAPDAVAVAEQAAAAAATLDDLRAAIAAYDHCDLKKGARNLVFSDGIPGAPVMLIGEAPGREEDRAGKPFVGRAGQLLDRMLAAIDMGRDRADAPVYITNALPWRPPQNRDPKPDEIAMMRPFLLRHIALAQPRVLVIVGNWSCQALLGKRGITRLRGNWTEAAGLPALPIFHPAYLLRSPEFKRETWADLLALRARLSHG
ncbi:uracil-DNA glycosylase [Sulfitobacter alexandrii]|uniref:Type-4 uracil-DNA glycosylase n=1 Tax=Sulfitobacter alexandrii TaxID=1917485 RepID=A0A1J0WE42_9RHOB|nr:uracil-DNA glycosylase [Sulfitobacter alexandrii]APE42589.1 uracil-DNA glycosylase [Sulfitobacter alexandrii]